VCETERERETSNISENKALIRKFLTKEEEAGKTFAMKIFTKSL